MAILRHAMALRSRAKTKKNWKNKTLNENKVIIIARACDVMQWVGRLTMYTMSINDQMS